MALAERMRDAAAISDVLYLRRDASRREIS